MEAMDKEPPPTPKSKLETLSREDLVRFTKKQAITCKQLRQKNEELERLLKSAPSSASIPICDASVQTVRSSEDQEECQWLRMALSAKPDDRMDQDGKLVNENRQSTAKSDVSCQASASSDEVNSVTVECQTDTEEPAVTPMQEQANPDALKEAKTQLGLLASELDQARQQLASQSMLKLEMEDTERSFEKLQTELRQTAAQLSTVQKENALLSQDIQALKQRLASAEIEREEVKKKLGESEAKSDSLFKENSSDKLEMKAMQSKLEKVEEALERMKLETASDASSTEQKVCKLQAALDETKGRLEKSESARTIAEKQVEDLNNEYRAYRTRVHSVLKQERKTAVGSTENFDSNAAEEYRKADQQLIASLREQLEKSKQLYESCRCDLERVREQHDQLYERHRLLRVHADEVEAQWKYELESMRADSARVARLHAEQIRALTTDKRDLQRDFERRIEDLLAERRERVGTLEQKVAELEEELSWSKKQLAENSRKWNKSEMESDPREEAAGRRRGNVESAEYAKLSRPLMERKPAEGAENADTAKKVYPLSNMGSGEVFERQRSLEDLLADQQSVHSLDAATTQPSKEGDVSPTVAKLHHLTELLSESEANNSRLSEQIKILKDEIRRLERNNERSEHVANAEYLKNIIMQFLNPSLQDRRQRLLPVLTTLLRLSPEEVALLSKESTTDAAPSSSATSSGWGGYIHRWSGLN